MRMANAATWILFCALLAPLPQAASAEAPEKTKINVATASLGLPYLPLIIAQQRKYFADEGLQVEIAAFSGGSKALQSLMGGSSDVASGAYSNTLTMAAKGQRLKNFVVQVRYPALTIAVSRRVADRYKSPADLKGMKIGVSAPGSSTHMIVAHLLGKGGLKSDDVSIIGVGTSGAAVAAIEKGEIDAIINSDPVMTKLETDGAIKIIAETRTAKGTEDLFGGPYPEAGLYATAGFIAKNPNTVQALTNAMVRALLWMQEASPQQILATVPEEYTLGNKAMYLFAYNNVKTAYSKDGYFSDAGAKTTLKALASFNPNVKAQEINLAQTYTNEFVKKAHAKYGKKK